MPSDAMLKMMNSAHRALLKVSGGRIGWTAGKMPALELTTIGRKSGQRRSVMLTSPVQEDDAIVIVASKGGEDTHPDWFVNLEANPEVEVVMAGKDPEPMTAEVADASTRARLWPQITEKYKNYAGYQRKTDREIPVVLLRPRG